MEASAAEQSNQKSQTTSTGHGSDSNSNGGKSRADLYAGAVAQRVLHGPSQCRRGGPRRVAAANGKPPSRLSKMSGASAEAT
ncbi:unnamed protein product [Urochloa humidicola]